MAVLEQRHDADGNDRLGHREDAEDRVVRHRRRGRRVLPADRVEPADLALPRHQHGDAGHGSLVDLALEGVRHPLQADGGQPKLLRLGVGEGGRPRGGCRPGGGLRVHGLSLVGSCCCGHRRAASAKTRSLAQKRALEQGVCRFALAIRACPVLETPLNRRQRQVPCRSVAQLVEHRSPKPGVAGSSPATPASYVADTLHLSQFSFVLLAKGLTLSSVRFDSFVRFPFVQFRLE